MLKMYKCVYLAVLVIFVTSATAATSVSPTQIIKKGTTLVYDVNYGGSRYEFTMVVKDQASAYSFDWSISAPINKKGSVTINKDAVQNATCLYNYFSNGEAGMGDQCCIMLSKKMFEAFKKNSSVEILTDKKNNEVSVFGNPYDHTQTFGYNNNFSNEFDCRTVTNGDTYQITYVNDADFPLIIEMNVGWSIKLRNIFN